VNGATLNPWRAWCRFWFAPISARPLALFRVAFGLICLEHLALLAPEATLWLSDAGYLVGGEARELAGPFRWSPLQWWQTPTIVHLCLAATALAAVAVILGWRTRLASVALYAGLLAIHHRNLLTVSGADTLLLIAAFWLMLSPAGATLSLDARRSSRRRNLLAEPLIVPWPQRMLQLQLVIVYLGTALSKAAGQSWTSGVALHDVLSNRELRRWTLGLLDQPEWINALTFATLILQLALPLLIWFRPTRPWMIAAGLTFHAAILLTVNIPVFGELACSFYLLFLAADEVPWPRQTTTLEPKPSASAESTAAHLPPPHLLPPQPQNRPNRSTLSADNSTP
jgi:hypothetical protein